MSYGNGTFEPMTRKDNKRAKPPGDFDNSSDAKRVRERSKQQFSRNDKRQQWQDNAEF